MEGVQLTFFVHEDDRLHGKLASEWILDRARTMGIHGGTAFRGVAGFGRDRVLHEDHFFDLGGPLPLWVTFILSDEEASALLEEVGSQDVSFFFVKSPVEFGMAGGKTEES